MNNKNLKFCMFFLLCNGIYFSAKAQEEKEENSLDQIVQELPFTQTVYLQDQNEIQQTLKGWHTEGSEQVGNILGYEIEYGLVDWLQFSAGYTYEHWNSESIPYDSGWLEIGTAVNIFQNTKQAASFALEAEFPVKKPEVEDIEAEDEPSYSPALLYAVEFYKTQLHLNAGAEISEEETNWFYNAAAVYGKGKIHPLLEINAVSEEDFNWYAGTGLVLNGESGWEFGAGIRHGIGNSKWDGTLHLIYEFNAEGKE